LEIKINEGLSHIVERTVTGKDLASKVGSGLVDVYATPAMIALMEEASHMCVGGYLPDGYITVGIEIHVRHLKPTPRGMKVKCESVLKKTDGLKLYFEVEAWDEKGRIGSGTHTRYIVNKNDFIRKTTG
jgi:fluoroacetyl-CoA thioesterase